MKRIGILGGGQLARMIIEENSKYGYEFFILSREENSPAGQITKHEHIGDWNNKSVINEFSQKCDVITLENEFIDYHVLGNILSAGKIVLPGPEVIRLIQDKLYQKHTLSKAGIPVADYCEVSSYSDVNRFAEEHGFPLVLKSRTMGYDGKGNATLNSESDIVPACDDLSKRGALMCEKHIAFEKEIAVQAIRSATGEMKFYPVVETMQEDHICNLVIAGEPELSSFTERVNKMVSKILEKMDYVGVMGIEMFLADGKILVNELAPRVHNTGHYTIEACHTSQFENHVRAILGFPLGSTEMHVPAAVMINILARKDGTAEPKGFEQLLQCRETFIHIYGKGESRKGRKMGHITLTGNDPRLLIEKALTARSTIDM